MSVLGDLLFLLYDAHNRIERVVGVLEEREDQRLTASATDRFFDGARKDLHKRLAVVEATTTFELEWPDRLRAERRDSRPGNSRTIETRADGLWEVFLDSGEARRVSMQPRSVLGIDVFDPVFLLSGFRLEPRGHEEVAGREAVTVAVAMTPTCEASPFDHHDLLHEIAVDAERGVLLRGVWRYGEAEAKGFVFREIRFESHQSSR